MIKRLAHACLGLTCAVAVSISAARAQDGTDRARSETAAIQDAFGDLQRGDTQRAEATLLPAVVDPAFSQLTPQMQHIAYRILGSSQLANGRAKDALETLKHACEPPWADGVDWGLRFQADFGAQDMDDAVVSLTETARLSPDMVGKFNNLAVMHVVDLAASGPADKERALLDALEKAGWAPNDPFLPGDTFYIEIARLRLEDGKPDAALAAARKIGSTRGLAAIRSDKRLEPLIAADPAFFDPDRFFDRVWKNTSRAAADAPDKLEGVNAKARLLLQRGEAAKALALVDKALKRIGDAEDNKTFSDQADQISWTMDLKSNALVSLGRYDEAIETMRAAARHSDSGGGGNVSQTINLAVLLNSLGRPKEALAAVAFADHLDISPFGKMVLATTRACAYAQIGDTDGLREELSFLEAHNSDNVQAHLDGLVCAQDDDGAAKLIISELDSPAGRKKMLLAIQDYQERDNESASKSAVDHTDSPRLGTILARPDVAAAVKKAGRIEHYDFGAPRF